LVGPMRVIFLMIFKVPKTSKILKNRYWHQQMASKHPENFFCPNANKNPSIKLD
jgi:hypothetical protein